MFGGDRLVEGDVVDMYPHTAACLWSTKNQPRRKHSNTMCTHRVGYSGCFQNLLTLAFPLEHTKCITVYLGGERVYAT